MPRASSGSKLLAASPAASQTTPREVAEIADLSGLALSPDGKWIAYIAYGQDIQPEDHPYYRHCYLKLMPIEGGPAKVIAYVYGGQGTMNVPSWSPDSRSLAFVSNTGN